MDSSTEHLLYCVSDRKTPWHLPNRKDFSLLSKVVITHVAKSKCKLAIYTKVDWATSKLPLASGMIKRAALQDMKTDALDLTDVLSDQVRRLVGVHGRTKKAVNIFGLVGQQTQVSEFAGSESPLNARLRRSRKRRTLTSIVLYNLGSLAETIAASVLQIIGNCIQWGWKTVTANSLILALLTFSIVGNLVFSSRNTSEWWRERRASRFMSKLGVGSDRTMSKAVYISDIGDLTVMDTSSSSSTLDGSGSSCRNTFDNIMNLSESPDSGSLGIASTRISHEPRADRLKRTRQNLGSRRHDLLVAMRVVNSIEREVLKAEWEAWLVEENARCLDLGSMLRKNKTNLEGEKRMEVARWHEIYCGSCERESARMPAL